MPVPSKGDLPLGVQAAHDWGNEAEMHSWFHDEWIWRVNLDGSDASVRRGLPRLEVSRGLDSHWSGLCILPDNSCRLRTGSLLTREAAQRAAIEEALDALGLEYRLLLRQLLAEVVRAGECAGVSDQLDGFSGADEVAGCR
jgi:hypothetical protein